MVKRLKGQIDITKGVYIPSIEAEELYDMSVRGLENIMKYEYKGYIPYSLELIKLRQNHRLFGERIVVKNHKEKHLSDALINVKFKNKLKKGKQITSFVRDYDNLMARLQNQKNHITGQISSIKKDIEESKNERLKENLEKNVNFLKNKARLIKGHYKRIKKEQEEFNNQQLISNKRNLIRNRGKLNKSTCIKGRYKFSKAKSIYDEIKAEDLRKYLYVNGFTFRGREYVFYKRTASKSRQSQALWILKDLHDRMKKWSHIGIDLTGKVDVASLLAYESLVSSSIESTIEINPDNVFVIDDKFSEFTTEAIEVGNDLKAVKNDKAEIKNNIWDGQALIDVSLMEKADIGDKGMALLRQHFFKSCAFNANIQKFLIDKHKEISDPTNKNYDSKVNPNYDEWSLKDMFGNKVLAKDILLITTPSSLKFLKYYGKSKVEQKKAFANWKKHVKKDAKKGIYFGICKNEKSSKYDDRSFTSYQMINTILADEEDISNLAAFEVEYIKSLQGTEDKEGNLNDEPFIEYLEKKKTLTNAYEMLSEIYKINKDIVRTQLFRDYRKKQIANYRTKVKGGKIRLLAEYAVVVGNPYEMLESVLEDKGDSNLIEKTSILQGNEIHTKLYEFDKEYTLVRNPHNAMNNFFRAKNIDNPVFDKYFNFTKNIVVINNVKSPITSVLNGMDQDSDSVLIFKDSTFNKIIKNTLENRKYPVILNKVISKPNPVELNNKNICITDIKTAKSQFWIGEVTNAAQFQVSCLWDIQHRETDSLDKRKKINEILDNIAVLVVLSNIAIDYSKKIVEVDIDAKLSEIKKSKATKVLAPMKDKEGNIKYYKNGTVKKKLKCRKKPNFWKYVSSSEVEMDKFSTPMDLLIEHIDSIPSSKIRKNIHLKKLLINEDLTGADNKQIEDIIKLVQDFDKKFKKINVSLTKDNNDDECQENQILKEKYINELDDRIAKKKIKKATMYKILLKVDEMYKEKRKQKGKNEKDTLVLSGISTHLLNTLYRTHGKTFLNLFKKS